MPQSIRNNNKNFLSTLNPSQGSGLLFFNLDFDKYKFKEFFIEALNRSSIEFYRLNDSAIYYKIPLEF